MKKLTGVLFAVLAAIAVMSCSKNVDYKTVRDKVMEIHDVVMADHVKIANNQLKLDTLFKQIKTLKVKFPELDTLKEKVVMKMLSGELTKTEALMDDWMHEFEPDVTGKSDEAAVQYFQAEKTKITTIDSLYKAEIKKSDEYLNRFKKP